MAYCQQILMQLIHRYRGQARSHSELSEVLDLTQFGFRDQTATACGSLRRSARTLRSVSAHVRAAS